MDTSKLDEQISLLREGNTLTENEVKALCDKVKFCPYSCRGSNILLGAVLSSMASFAIVQRCVAWCRRNSFASVCFEIRQSEYLVLG
jgi:hypothetical protein